MAKAFVEGEEVALTGRVRIDDDGSGFVVIEVDGAFANPIRVRPDKLQSLGRPKPVRMPRDRGDV